MKYENIINETWEYLDNNYKGSEITMELWLRTIEKECDNDYCLKQCVKLAWNNWEWFCVDEKEYMKKYIKDRYGIKVV